MTLYPISIAHAYCAVVLVLVLVHDRYACVLLQRHCKLSRGSVSVRGDREHLLKSVSYVSLNGKLKKLQVIHYSSIQ
jgi:hypothetical protein